MHSLDILRNCQIVPELYKIIMDIGGAKIMKMMKQSEEESMPAQRGKKVK